MAINYGKDGYLHLAGEKMLFVNSWELSVADDALEITAFSSTTPFDRSFVAGLRNATATFSGYYEDTSTGQYQALSYLLSTGTPSTVAASLFYYYLTSETFAGFAGGAVLTGITLGNAVDGLQTISGNLQFDGGVHTTAASS
jgi:hypothetical protein